MSAYPPYSFQPQQMNNLYQGDYQPMQNPYMAQIGQYQQNFQPQVQQVQAHQSIGLVGRAVNDFSEIKADDVPMNGTPAIFIKNDMSEIEVRVWCKDGLIRPTSYKPVEQNGAEGANPQMEFNALNEDMRILREDILAKLDSIEKSMGNTTAKTTRGKKAEVSAGE